MAADAGDEVAEKINNTIERLAAQEVAKIIDALARQGVRGLGAAGRMTTAALGDAARSLASSWLDIEPASAPDAIAEAAAEEAAGNSRAADLAALPDVPDDSNFAELYAATSAELSAQRAALDAYGVRWADCGQTPKSGFYQTTCVAPFGMPDDFYEMLRANSPGARVGAMGLSGAIAQARASMGLSAEEPSPGMSRDFELKLVTDLADPEADRIVDWLQAADVLPISYHARIDRAPEAGRPGLAIATIYPEHAALAKKIIEAAEAEIPGFEARARVSNWDQLSAQAQAEDERAEVAARRLAASPEEARTCSAGLPADVEIVGEDGTVVGQVEIVDSIVQACNDAEIAASVSYSPDGTAIIEVAETEVPSLAASRDMFCAQVGRAAAFKGRLKGTMARINEELKSLAGSMSSPLVSRVKAEEMRQVDLPERAISREASADTPSKDRRAAARAIGKDSHIPPRRPNISR